MATDPDGPPGDQPPGNRPPVSEAPHEDAFDGDPIADQQAADERDLSLAHRIALRQGLVLGAVALMVGVAVLLYQVQRPGSWNPNLPADPTPIGYMLGMAIYVIPTLAALYMLAQVKTFDLYKKTLLVSVGSMFAVIFVLDITLVGSSFFHFPNCGAYIEYIGAYDLVDGVWEPDSVPVEDVAFYLFALLCTCTTYIWSSLYWFPNASPYFRKGRLYPSRAWDYVWTFDIHWNLVAVGVVSIGGAWLLQWHMTDICTVDFDGQGLTRFCKSPDRVMTTCIDGVSTVIDEPNLATFPWYWTFLTLSAVLPSLFLGRRVGRLVNWPAFSFTFTGMVLVSIILAVTMAVPYQWWTFEPDVMIGLYFNAWFGVPIEQTFLYLVTPWVAVLWVEFMHAFVTRNLSPDDPRWQGIPAVDLSYGDKPPVLPPEAPE